MRMFKNTILGLLALLFFGCHSNVGIEFRLAESEPGAGLTKINVPDQRRDIYLHQDAVLTNEDIKQAALSIGSMNEPQITLAFTQEGKEKIAEVTKNNIGKTLAGLVDGKLVVAAVVMEPVTEGPLMLSGHWSFDDARRLVDSLNRAAEMEQDR